MKNLLKADLFRSLKSRTILIGLIICLLTGLLTPVLYKLMYVMASEDAGEVEMMIGSINGLNLFKQTLNISGDIAAFYLPICIGMFIISDFKDNTIRNKITAGYSRTKIYFSHVLTGIIVAAIYLISSALISLIFGSIFFGFSTVEVGEAIGVLIITLILYLILNAIILSIVFMLAINKQNIIIAIIIPISLSLAFSLIGSLITTNNVLAQIYSFTAYYQSTELLSVIELKGLVTVAATSNVKICALARILISSAIVIPLINYLGCLWFKKVDLK